MLVLWAQSLDNQSPDEIRTLDGNETREAAIAAVYLVVEQGRKLFSRGGVDLIHHKGRTVLEVVSSRMDEAGRLTPLVCFSDHNDDGCEHVMASLISFSAELDRPITHEQIDLVNLAFDELKKKRITRRLYRPAVILLGVLVLVIAYVAWQTRLYGSY